MVGEPRDGVISSRRARKEVMSNSWSDLMSVVSDASSQFADVTPLAMVTMEVQIDLVTSSFRSPFVIVGKIAFNTARDEVVAWRQGEILLVVMGKEYLSTIGFDSASREDDNAPLV